MTNDGAKTPSSYRHWRRGGRYFTHVPTHVGYSNPRCVATCPHSVLTVRLTKHTSPPPECVRVANCARMTVSFHRSHSPRRYIGLPEPAVPHDHCIAHVCPSTCSLARGTVTRLVPRWKRHSAPALSSGHGVWSSTLHYWQPKSQPWAPPRLPEPQVVRPQFGSCQNTTRAACRNQRHEFLTIAMATTYLTQSQQPPNLLGVVVLLSTYRPSDDSRYTLHLATRQTGRPARRILQARRKPTLVR